MFVISFEDLTRITPLFPIKNRTTNGAGVTLSVPREPGKISIFLKGADQINPKPDTPVIGWKANTKTWIKFQVKPCLLENPTVHPVHIQVIFKTRRINVYAGKKRIIRFSFEKYSDISIKNICRVADHIYDTQGQPVEFSESLWIENGEIKIN